MPLPVNKFPNKLAPKVPNNISRNSPFCSFTLFLIVSLTPTVNSNCIKTLLAYGLSTFPIKGNPVCRNVLKSLPKNPLHCPILCNQVFDNFILAEELFAKVLRSFETCVLVNNLCGKLSHH